MKCNFCGADIRNSDEICPECGKYLADTPAEKTNSKAEKFGKTLRFYDYRDGLAFNTLLYVIFGLVIIGFSVYSIWDFGYFSFYSSTAVTQTIIGTVIGILIISLGIFSYFKLKSCSVALCENGIYGYIPTNPHIPFKTVYFEVCYNEIEKLEYKNIGASRHSSFAIIIRTKSEKFTISLLKNENTKHLSDCLYELIDT